jgi:hypothetical protein
MQRISLSAAVVGLGVSLAAACEPGTTSDSIPSDDRQTLSQEEREQLIYRWRGQTEFVSHLEEVWLPLQHAMAEQEAIREDVISQIREADIFRWDPARNLLISLNAFRGLQIVDLSNPDMPRLVASDRLAGLPVDLFIRGDHAFVMLADLREPDPADPASQESMLRIYDLSDPLSPDVAAEVAIPGRIDAARLVATDPTSTEPPRATIYVVSTVETDMGPTTYITSIDVTSPAAPVEVEQITFPGEGSMSMLTPELVMLSRFDASTGMTTVQLVDISDVEGDIVVRATFEVLGHAQWGAARQLQMDLAGDILRIATVIPAMGTEPASLRFTTVDLGNPDMPVVLGTVSFPGTGATLLPEVRFAGERAYFVSPVAPDEIHAVDLSDPAHPQMLGAVDVGELVLHYEARGHKLVVLASNPADPRQVSIVLLDVTNPAAPVELARAEISGAWDWSQALFDPRPFMIIDELGLIQIPVVRFSQTTGRAQTFLQLVSIDLTAGTLTARGAVAAPDIMRRAFAAGGRLVSFGEFGLLTIDLTDLDNPVVRGTAELANEVLDFVAMGPRGVALVSRPFLTEAGLEIRIMDLEDADERIPLGRVAVSLSSGELFAVDATHAVVVGETLDASARKIIIIDTTNPAMPRVRGQLTVAPWAYEVASTGKALAVAGPNPAGRVVVHLVDLRNFAFPSIAASVNLGPVVLQKLEARGQKVFVSAYVPEGQTEPEPTTHVSNVLYVMDLAKPQQPKAMGPVSVPGSLVQARTLVPGLWTLIHTNDRFKAADGREPVRGFDSLVLVEPFNTAMLVDVVEVPMDASKVVSEGTAAFYSHVLYDDVTGRPEQTDLHAIDLTFSDRLIEGDVLELPEVRFGVLGAVAGGRAFVKAGWALVDVVDVTDPYEMEDVGLFVAPGWVEDVIRVGTRAFLPSGLFGTHILPVVSTLPKVSTP